MNELKADQDGDFVKTSPVALVGIDSEDNARTVIEFASRVTYGWPGMELHLAHVVNPIVPPASSSDQMDLQVRDSQLDDGRRFISRMGDYAASLFPGIVRVHLVFADPADGILRAAERVEAELIIVGTHDYKGVKRLLLGSVAAEVSRGAHAPVLVVRPLSYPGSLVPAIEPVCPGCAKVRLDTRGAEMWCARHSEHHPRAHLHYEYPAGFAYGSQMLRTP